MKIAASTAAPNDTAAAHAGRAGLARTQGKAQQHRFEEAIRRLEAGITTKPRWELMTTLAAAYKEKGIKIELKDLQRLFPDEEAESWGKAYRYSGVRGRPWSPGAGKQVRPKRR
jgi:hypothetical protein